MLALLGALRAALRTRSDLTLENLALRQQLALLRRRSKRPQFGRLDRLLWVWLSNHWAGWGEALHLVRPESVIRWHRQGFRTMALANPLWGAPRIDGELLKLGLDISQRTVARLMPPRPKLPSQTWRTFLQNRIADLVPSTSSSCQPRPSGCSTCSWSCCIIAGRSCTSMSPIPPLPPGRRNKLSKRSPMTRRRATSSAIETASTAASFGDGSRACASPRFSRHHAPPGRTCRLQKLDPETGRWSEAAGDPCRPLSLGLPLLDDQGPNIRLP